MITEFAKYKEPLNLKVGDYVKEVSYESGHRFGEKVKTIYYWIVKEFFDDSIRFDGVITWTGYRKYRNKGFTGKWYDNDYSQDVKYNKINTKYKLVPKDVIDEIKQKIEIEKYNL